MHESSCGKIMKSTPISIAWEYAMSATRSKFIFVWSCDFVFVMLLHNRNVHLTTDTPLKLIKTKAIYKKLICIKISMQINFVWILFSIRVEFVLCSLPIIDLFMFDSWSQTTDRPDMVSAWRSSMYGMIWYDSTSLSKQIFSVGVGQNRSWDICTCRQVPGCNTQWPLINCNSLISTHRRASINSDKITTVS